jgi:hypothetical protein
LLANGIPEAELGKKAMEKGGREAALEVKIGLSFYE